MCRGSQYPTGWKETTLGNLAHYINGYAFRPEDWKEIGLPIIRIQQINDPEAEYDCFDGPIADQYRIDSGDLLFSWSATLTTLIWNRGPAVLNQHIFKVIPREGADLHFLHHLLEYLMDELAGQTHGSTMRHIKRSDLLPFPVVVPSPEEQRCIAEILDAADEAIRQTERVIAKLKAVKAGLLHDLLTRGLDEHGHLRGPQAHPEQFKDSPLGRIPKEWDIVPLDSLTEYVTYGFTNPMPTTDDGPWMITAADIADGRIRYEQARHTSMSAYEALTRKSRPEVGDILVTKDGTLGRVAVVDQPHICINQSVACMRPLPETDVRFLTHYLRSNQGRERMLADAGGSTIKHIYISRLRQMEVPVPGRGERKKIIKILDAHDARIRAEEAELAKLRQVKRGLMDDLLTGRVRVT